MVNHLVEGFKICQLAVRVIFLLGKVGLSLQNPLFSQQNSNSRKIQVAVFSAVSYDSL